MPFIYNGTKYNLIYFSCKTISQSSFEYNQTQHLSSFIYSTRAREKHNYIKQAQIWSFSASKFQLM